MKSMFNRLLVVTAAVVAVMLPVTAVPAQAAQTVYLERTLWLDDEPTLHDPNASRTVRIYLGAGNYGWWPYVKPNAIVDPQGQCGGRVIYLDAGWYEWVLDIAPSPGYYVQHSHLQKEGSADVAFVECSWEIEFANEYTVGFGLDPHF